MDNNNFNNYINFMNMFANNTNMNLTTQPLFFVPCNCFTGFIPVVPSCYFVVQSQPILQTQWIPFTDSVQFNQCFQNAQNNENNGFIQQNDFVNNFANEQINERVNSYVLEKPVEMEQTNTQQTI